MSIFKFDTDFIFTNQKLSPQILSDISVDMQNN